MENSLLQPSSIPIRRLFSSDRHYTFLAGAGVSIEPPSCLQSARKIARILLECSCPAEEAEAILGMEKLRYEVIVEGIQQHFDHDLKLMDYFDLAVAPNFLHYFLAQAILGGIVKSLTIVPNNRKIAEFHETPAMIGQRNGVFMLRKL